MARKITGLQVDLGDDQPVVDVDTAVMQLLDELAQRPRMRAALATLINHSASWAAFPEGWVANEGGEWFGDTTRQIETANHATRVIALVPLHDTMKSPQPEEEGGRDPSST